MAENQKEEGVKDTNPYLERVMKELNKDMSEFREKLHKYEWLNTIYETHLEIFGNEKEAEEAFRKQVGDELFNIWKEVKSELAELSSSKDLDTCFLEAVSEVSELFQKADEYGDFSIEVFVRTIMKFKKFRTIIENEELLWYDDEKGVYRENGEKVVKKLCELIWTRDVVLRYLKPIRLRKLTTHFVNEVINAIKRRTYVSNTEFDKDPFIINVKNGLLDIRTKELKPHTPEYLSRIQINAEYNPDAKCPKIDKFISEIVPEKYRKLLYQIPAYCLFPDYKYEKAFMLVGDGENGKSTYLNLITHFLGEDNVSHVSLQSLTNNRFARSRLIGKLANIFADIPSTKLYSTGDFKTLTGGDRMEGEKKFKDSVPFRNRAKLIFSANELPPVNDRTWAFWRRWILIEFPYKFDGKERPKDPNILKKLTTREELSGFLNKIIDEYVNLLRNGFIEQTDLGEIWMRRSNSVYAFVRDRLERDVNSFVPKEDLYKEYVEYCDENDLAPVAKNKFGNSLPKEIPTTTQKILYGGKRVKVWSGIRLKPKEEFQYNNLVSRILEVVGDNRFSIEDLIAKINDVSVDDLQKALDYMVKKGLVAQVNSNTWIKV